VCDVNHGRSLGTDRGENEPLSAKDRIASGWGYPVATLEGEHRWGYNA
jgi:hypothetical protein